MRKRILTGIIVILSVVLFLAGFHIVGSLLEKLDQKIAYHRQELVAEIDRVMGKNINRLDMAVKHTLQNQEVQKAAEDFLYRLYYSETANGIKGQVNNKVNHGLWTFLGAVEGIYGLRPAYVDRLKEFYPEGPKGVYFPVDAGYSVDPNQYKFHFLEGAKEIPEAKVKTKPEVAEKVVKEAPAEKKPAEVTEEATGTVKEQPSAEETPPPAPAPAPTPTPPDNSAIEETKKLLEGM